MMSVTIPSESASPLALVTLGHIPAEGRPPSWRTASCRMRHCQLRNSRHRAAAASRFSTTLSGGRGMLPVPCWPMSVDREAVAHVHDQGTGKQRHVRPDAGAVYHLLPRSNLEILRHGGGEDALVAYVMAVHEDRYDQCCKPQPGPQRARTVDVRSHAHEGEVDER